MTLERSVRMTWGRLWVGVLIMSAVGALLWASLTGGGTSIFDKKGSFYCYFYNVEGLVKGSPIWMSGLEVGNVTSLGFDKQDSVRLIRVNCHVKKSVWPLLTKDARVQLGTIGFLGDKYVEIVPGVLGGAPIQEGDEIITQDVGNASAVFAAAEVAAKSAGSVVSGLDTLLNRMNRGEGTLGKLATDEQFYTQLTSLLTNLTKLTADLQANQDRLVTSLEKMSNAVGDLAGDVNENKGTLGRLVNDPQLYDNLTSTSAKLDSILAKVNRPEGNVGLLVNDTGLYVELVNLLNRANNLVTDIEKNPGRYLKFSVF
jgi:phospholipid/cholesterol/gamma-HCH transport system substrate-binding protein